MTGKKVSLVSESWIGAANHDKGWDGFSSATFHLGAEPLVTALKDTACEFKSLDGLTAG